MEKKRKKFIWLIAIIICIIAIVILLIGFKNFVIKEFNFESNNEKHINYYEIVQIITDFYEFIDNGLYEELYDLTIEGQWEIKDGDKSEYRLIGVTDRNDFIENTSKLFGENGELLNLQSIEINSIEKISNNELEDLFSKENEVLTIINEKSGKYINIVHVKGYISQSCNCAMLKWEKKLPIIQINKKLKVLLPGVPEEKFYLYKEQWFDTLFY